MDGECGNTDVRWFAMRDLSRRHAKYPAYKRLADLGFEVFTPMMSKVVVVRGRKVSREVPFMMDLLFVHSSREMLDAVVEKTETLQYRFVYGGFREPMVVPTADMERFMYAVRSVRTPRYYRPEDITPSMYGRRVRIVGGPLDGYEGSLLSVRGSKFRRLLVELPGFVMMGAEVSPELVELVD